MDKILIVFFLGLATVCVCQQRPQISKLFEARVNLEFRDFQTHQSHFGEGWIVLDQPDGKGVEWMNFPGHHEMNSYRIQRYDLHKDYEIHLANKSCHERTTEGDMPDEWAWLSNANYSGEAEYGHKKVSIWEATIGYATLRLAVDATSTNTPVWLHRKAAQSEMHLEFIHYSTAKPNQEWFAVPNECSTESITPSGLGCVARDKMIARAKVWVSRRVPYNQGATYEGYREDCSGYVSMCWESSKPGHTTFTFHEISHPISKGELKPGDALLCASEHVVLFGGWSDSSHTHYHAFEETRPGEGTVGRVTPYPYWYNTGCFKPYRYNSAC